MRIEEERGSYERVLREDTEKVRETAVVIAERDEESLRRKEELPCFAGGFETSLVGVRDEGEDECCDVVGEAWNQGQGLINHRRRRRRRQRFDHGRA